jgi:Uma2 family endonuclease
VATVAPELMTAEEFFDWVHRPENRDRFFELERGKVVEMPPPGKYHGFVCGRVSGILSIFAAQRRRGYPCANDSGLVVEQDPDTVRGPDLTFYEDDQTAENMDRKYAIEPPRLVVEVLSPSDQTTKVNRRLSQYLKKGVPLVWLVDPEIRSVTVYRHGKDHYVLDEGEELTGEEVLPDFRCRVAEFFALPGAAP